MKEIAGLIRVRGHIKSPPVRLKVGLESEFLPTSEYVPLHMRVFLRVQISFYSHCFGFEAW